MAKEALTAIKDLTKGEVVAKMRSGDLVPPKKGAERDEFFKFVDMPKEQRETFLTEGVPSPDPSTPPEKKIELEEPPKETPKETPKEVSNEEPWWKAMGYGDETKAQEAHKSLLDLTSRLQGTVDKLNAKEGKSGNDMKRLAEERDKLSKELGELKKTSAPKIDKPEKPVRPKSGDYENGMLDMKYIEAKEKYDSDMDVYLEKNSEFIRESTKREILESLPKPVVTETQTVVDNEPWNKFFNVDVPEFQKKFNLITTVPVRNISDAYNVVADDKASTQDKTTAQAFLKSVPENDLKAYANIKTAVEIAFEFNSGIPQSRYKTIEGALFDNGLIGEGKQFNIVKPVQLSAEAERAARELARQKNDQTVSAISASETAGADKKLSEHQTVDEKKKRYKDILTMYNNALNTSSDAGKQFEKTPEWQEYLTLRKEILGKVPGYMQK
ncbi:MAG: hypothetical protein IMZ53_08215 [Thermoplasmata archaeon]|nr:hypothetical protein [Thermoplasmata archaeon]MBE3140552.1 hypothetical protein [Thermoplasmata archaeon]